MDVPGQLRKKTGMDLFPSLITFTIAQDMLKKIIS